MRGCSSSSFSTWRRRRTRGTRAATRARTSRSGRRDGFACRAPWPLALSGEDRALGRLPRDGDLGLDPAPTGGLVALVDRTEVDQRVFLFGLGGEAGRSPLLAAQAHLDAVRRADRRLRL